MDTWTMDASDKISTNPGYRRVIQDSNLRRTARMYFWQLKIWATYSRDSVIRQQGCGCHVRHRPRSRRAIIWGGGELEERADDGME